MPDHAKRTNAMVELGVAIRFCVITRQLAVAKCRFGSLTAALAGGSRVRFTPGSCRDNHRLRRQFRAMSGLPLTEVNAIYIGYRL
jgi:hypothetical protein